MDVLIATRNPGKFKEIVALFADLSQARFHSLDVVGVEGDFEETGETFEDNALGKARFFHERASDQFPQLITLADDSGLFVEALANELGVKTRRWGAGASASDAEWLDYFMRRLDGETQRAARFVCVAALIDAQGERCFMGEVRGEITPTIEGPLHPGIPVSSVFKPEGFDRVYTLMTPEEKNRYSHRGGAFSRVLDYLKSHSI